jgi:hypothetical protein
MIVSEHKIKYCGLIGYNTVANKTRLHSVEAEIFNPDLNMK